MLALANFQKFGWLHLNDNRVFAQYGRIPDPEDIIGSVLVKDGNHIDVFQGD